LKTIFIFGLFLLSLTSITCLAQSSGSSGDIFINQIYIPNNSTVTRIIPENDVFIRHSGYLNSVIVEQHAGSGGANLATIQQFGGLQQAALIQRGANNQAKYNQVGFGNQIDVSQVGDFISTNIFQFGLDNYVHQELGSDNTSYTIIQSGYNWGVVDKDFSPNNPGYTIWQHGFEGVTVTIEHN
jgi:hypothetical protein